VTDHRPAESAALLFIDFASGDLMQLQGQVTIDWDAQAPQKLRVTPAAPP
jgi:hypothetical protein